MDLQELERMLKDMESDLVERFGLGIQIARQQLAKNGNPPPEFLVESNNILVTVRE